MTWPTTSISTTNVDAGSDSPALARQQIKEAIDSLNILRSSAGSAAVGYVQDGIYAVNSNVQSKLREIVSVKDFGAAGDGSTDDSAAIQDAYDYLISKGGGELLFPLGTYKVNTTLSFGGTGMNQNSANITVRGAGGYSTTLDFTSASSGTDGVQIAGAGRIRINGLCIKNAKRFGLNANAGMSPGGDTYVSRFEIKDVIVEGSTSHGFRFANNYMGLLENLESRNNGGNGFHFEGNHTSITAIRCWAGGDGSNPNGGNAGSGWFINGLVYSEFIACGADWNEGAGYLVQHCSGVAFRGCGAEANDQEGWLIRSSADNVTNIFVPGIKGVTLDGCFGYKNSLGSVNSYANFVGIVTSGAYTAHVAITNCSDWLDGLQNISFVANGAGGQITLYEDTNKFGGNFSYTGTVVNGNFLQDFETVSNASNLTTGNTSNVGSPAISITLPPGDWDVYGLVVFTPHASTSVTSLAAGISEASATLGDQSTFVTHRYPAFVPGGPMSVLTPTVRVRSQTSKTVYLVTEAGFSVSTLTAHGIMYAKRAS